MVCIFHTGKSADSLVSVTKMPVSDAVFQEFLEINMHVYIVDTLLPSLVSTGNQASCTARELFSPGKLNAACHCNLLLVRVFPHVLG